MAIFQQILVVLGASLSYIEPAAAVGATQRDLRGRRIWQLGLIFALVTTGAFALGAGAGQLALVLNRSQRARWALGALALALMLGLGVGMLRRAAGQVQLMERRAAPVTLAQCAQAAVKWGVPIALAGATLGLDQRYNWNDMALAFVLAVLVCASGLLSGYRQGSRWVRPAYAIGGAAVCLAALGRMIGL